MKKTNEQFRTDVIWNKDTCEIKTFEPNEKRSNVTLLIDIQRGQYYVLLSEDEKRNLESISRVLSYLKQNYIDKIASYANTESLEYRAGESFDINLDEDGELQKRAGSTVTYLRNALSSCLNKDQSARKYTYSCEPDEEKYVARR